MKTWDFEDEHGEHWWCCAKNKREAYKEARAVLKRNKKYNSGKKVINLRLNEDDILETLIAENIK